MKRCIQLVVLLFYAICIQAQQSGRVNVVYYDSVEVSLMTCAPHEEVYSLYGHSALRWHDLHTGQDLVFNWGVFNFQKPFFVLRFVFGLTDYELGVTGFQPFVDYYQKWGAMVSEQILDLTSKEKAQLQLLLAENYRPENRVYRYNFLYDNCSTRPREMIEHCIDGSVKYSAREDYSPTFRQMVYEKTRRHDWATEGNNLLLGVKADLRTIREEQEFLPENLQYDVDRAEVYRNDGRYTPLVKARRVVVEPGVQIVERDFLISPMEVGITLTVVSLLVFVAEWRRRKTFKYWDVFLMSVVGLAGCMLFLMLFSQHPTTSTNLQVLLINPVHLFFIPAVFRRRHTLYWIVLIVMLALVFLGGIWQRYATLTPFLALCLLLRYCIHQRSEK